MRRSEDVQELQDVEGQGVGQGRTPDLREVGGKVRRPARVVEHGKRGREQTLVVGFAAQCIGLCARNGGARSIAALCEYIYILYVYMYIYIVSMFALPFFLAIHLGGEQGARPPPWCRRMCQGREERFWERRRV